MTIAKKKPGRPTSYSEADVRAWSARHPGETYLAIARSVGRSESLVINAVASFRSAHPDEAKASVEAVAKRRAFFANRARVWLERSESESLTDIASSDGISLATVSKAVSRLREANGYAPKKRWVGTRRDEAFVIAEQFGALAPQVCGLTPDEFRGVMYRNPDLEIDPDIDLAVQRGFAMARCALLGVTPADLIRCEAVMVHARRARLDELAEARA